MGKKLTILFLTLIVLAGGSVVYVVNGLQAYARYQQTSLADQEHCGGQAPVRICVRAPSALFSAFYPSYVATQSALVQVFYSSGNEKRTLQVSVGINGLTQTQTRTVTTNATIQAEGFVPPLLAATLVKLTSDYNTSLHIRVSDMQGHPYYVNDIPLALHSRWLMQWAFANRLQLGAWVTPNDPSVRKLVSKARAHLEGQPPPVPKALIGYEKAIPRQVIDQVNAIYDALRLDYKMRYTQASVPYNGPQDTNGVTQNIRLPSEVLQQHSGMCIEMALLLASAVESIGLHAEIVIIPGHAFLGVALTSDDQQFGYWDAVQVNNNVAGDSANIAADATYASNARHGTIVDKILISDARQAGINAML